MEGSTALERVLGDKYRLIRQLDQGGMGTVWYALHLALNAPVAVKLLELDDQGSGDAVARFLREAQTAASLRSPHVVQILDYGVDEQTPYIVMELLEGESLAHRLRRVSRLSPAETDVVITQIARAIGRAHDAGIVHRDLKPANVFVVRDAELELIKVLDFGIAKAAASPDANTQSGTFLGTPLYASPEQTQGIRALDHRTDIWSLGVIAFECLLGSRPFNGDTFGAIVLAVCTKPLPVPSKRGAVPAGFDDWFARACAREPAQRFASARQAAEALSPLCSNALTVDLGGTQALVAGSAPPASGHAATLLELERTGSATNRAASMSNEPSAGAPRGRATLVWLLLGVSSAVGVGGVMLLRGRSAEQRFPQPSAASASGALNPPALTSPPSPLGIADAGAPAASKPPSTRPALPAPSATKPEAKVRVKREARAKPARGKTPRPAPSEPEIDLGL